MGDDASGRATRFDALGAQGATRVSGPDRKFDTREGLSNPQVSCAHHARRARIIADRLAELLPDSRLLVIDGAGHMGPFTHASKIAGLIVRHITTIDAQTWGAESRTTAAQMEAVS